MMTRAARFYITAASALALGAAMGAPTVLRAQQTEPPPAIGAASAAQDSLLSRQERAQWEALKARDTTAFAHLMGGGLVDVDLSGIKRTSPASTARYVLGCQTTSYMLSELRVAHFGLTAIVTYKAAVEATCWGQKAPSPLYVMTVYEQRGDAWRPIAHSETPAAHW
jgi:ketosteroid isomerase-like protein